jgi:hypothetical protein
MADYQLLLRQRHHFCYRPATLVIYQAGDLQLPRPAIDGLYILDVVVGVEARGLHNFDCAKRWRKMIRAENCPLDNVVPSRDLPQSLLDRAAIPPVAPGQHRQGAQAQGAAEKPTPAYQLHKPFVLLEHTLVDSTVRPEQRGEALDLRHDRPVCSREDEPGGWADGTRGPPVIIAITVFGTSNASATWITTKPQIADIQRKWTRRTV